MSRPPVLVEMSEISAIVDRTQTVLNTEEHAKLKAAITTLALVTQELESKRTSLDRLRKMVFGEKTEKLDKIFGDTGPAREEEKKSSGEKSKKKRPGHGRHGADDYTGAEIIPINHAALSPGDRCAGCEKGRLYPLSKPAELVRITGMAPLSGKVYQCDRLRCNLCGEVKTAPAPDGVGAQKYDESATSMIGMIKYGAGLPFNRIEKLQAEMGIPMPAATQWELVRDGAELLAPAHKELIDQAAQGKVLYNDDTTMKVLELSGEARAEAAIDDPMKERTGVFTSGIVATTDQHQIALFFTGVKHAGENIGDVLARRAKELPAPIQMCDALSRNSSKDFKTIMANCNTHARRMYVEVAEAFPKECEFVLKILSQVYKTDATAREQRLSAAARLAYHQVESEPVMKELELWMKAQFDEHKVEPNSGLGKAIGYMQRHWSKLTLFLHEPGAPLDNNLCERALKKVILHRKNALFYKTANGARVGDIYMSLIHTCELNGEPTFDYLLTLLRNPREVAATPAKWMPWNYREALGALPPRPTAATAYSDL